MKLKIDFPGILMPHFALGLMNIKHQIQRNNLFALLLILLWGALFLFVSVNVDAQEIKEFKVGDTLPDVVINDIINYKSTSLKLSDFKGKVIVLDFWSTHCGNCIQSFPDIYTLQKKLEDKLQVLLVDSKNTRDKIDNIESFFARRKNEYKFPTAVLDTTLIRMFPHLSIPHEVWIKDNVVIAITDETQVNEKNVLGFFDNDRVETQVKPFDTYDFNKPIFSGLQDSIYFHTIFAHYNSKVRSTLGLAPTEEGFFNKIFAVNIPRLQLIEFAYSDYSWLNDRIIYRVHDPADFSSDSVSENWKVKNQFIYESTFPPCSRNDAIMVMRQDLLKYLQLTVDTVVKETTCYVLEVSDSSKISKGKKDIHQDSNIHDNSSSPKFFINTSLDIVAKLMEEHYGFPVINETAYADHIDLTFPADMKNRKAVKQAFKLQGLRISERKRKITFFMISDNKDFLLTSNN